MESRIANGEQIDIGEHAVLCSTLVRIAQRIGINRRLRNVTPHLADYIEDRAMANMERAAATEHPSPMEVAP
jgi:hypothetical protein